MWRVILHISFTGPSHSLPVLQNAYGYGFFSVRLRIQSCTLRIFFRTVTVIPVTVPEYFSARLRGWWEKTDGKSWIPGWKNLIFVLKYCVKASKKPVYISKVFKWRMWRIVLHTQCAEYKYAITKCEGVKEFFGKIIFEYGMLLIFLPCIPMSIFLLWSRF